MGDAIKLLLEQLSVAKDLKKDKRTHPQDSHPFWSTQPVPKQGENITLEGSIEGDKELTALRQKPLGLLPDFEWFLVDINNEQERTETYQLLTANYVEDDDAVFRFDYSADFLLWALQPPGWKKDWHLGIRVIKTKKMVAFISGVPADLVVNEKETKVVEINFLCIHKKLRSKRLAPVMIKEITRRVNFSGIFQAVYTAGLYLPKPISTVRYFHRSLNPRKLIEARFSELGEGVTIEKLAKFNRLPNKPFLNISVMTEDDVPAVKILLGLYLAKFPFAPLLSEGDVMHWLLPKKDVLYSYVVKDEGGKVTDFVSFYSLPSSITGNAIHSHIQAAFLFYYAPMGLGSDPQRIAILINDALILARTAKFDVFNCVTLGDNSSFVDELKFGAGSGYLHYYMFNYRVKDLNPNQLNLKTKAPKRIGVRLRSTDTLGAAPMPEGYLKATAEVTPLAPTQIPLSYYERNRIVQESRPYVAPAKVNTNKKMIRVGGGEIWNDPTLVHWAEDDYRLFAGDLGNEVTDEMLSRAFSQYPSMQRTAVIRDKKSNKTKGFGFVSFSNADDYVKAMREMNGKYVGTRPITLKKSNWKDRMATPDSIQKQKDLAVIAGRPLKRARK